MSPEVFHEENLNRVLKNTPPEIWKEVMRNRKKVQFSGSAEEIRWDPVVNDDFNPSDSEKDPNALQALVN
jgi:hypothetical protein